ncbi:MAG: zinc dependent phospholipase C family protein [Polyangia bacterium]
MLLLIPNPALAWGPVAHLDIGTQLLSGAVALAPSLLRLIESRRLDFLYGSLAADAIVGKNRSCWHEHCHNWDVARSLLAAAEKEGESRRAFMLGYLGHLGADVVAHNHIVPQMLILHYRAKGIGHLYWEARVDNRLLEEHPKLEETWLELGRARFPGHDRFLSVHLAPALISNRMSSQLFRRSIDVQSRRPWKIALRRIDRGSRLMLPRETLLRWSRLALEGARRAVTNPHSRRLDRLDPTGRQALEFALAKRRALRRMMRRGVGQDEVDEAYREALDGTQVVDINHFEDDPASEPPRPQVE